MSVLSEKQRGRPLLLGGELYDQVKSFVHEMSSGRVANEAAAKGIILAKDANLLQENGGASTSQRIERISCLQEWGMSSARQQSIPSTLRGNESSVTSRQLLLWKASLLS